jgi:hypothetical protein
MSSADLLKEAETNTATNPQLAIQLYKQILANTAGRAATTH